MRGVSLVRRWSAEINASAFVHGYKLFPLRSLGCQGCRSQAPSTPGSLLAGGWLLQVVAAPRQRTLPCCRFRRVSQGYAPAPPPAALRYRGGKLLRSVSVRPSRAVCFSGKTDGRVRGALARAPVFLFPFSSWKYETLSCAGRLPSHMRHHRRPFSVARNHLRRPDGSSTPLSWHFWSSPPWDISRPEQGRSVWGAGLTAPQHRPALAVSFTRAPVFRRLAQLSQGEALSENNEGWSESRTSGRSESQREPMTGQGGHTETQSITISHSSCITEQKTIETGAEPTETITHGTLRGVSISHSVSKGE